VVVDELNVELNGAVVGRAAALVPLAWVIGELTERLAEQTSGAVAAFVNATVGNAPELIIALVAVVKGVPPWCAHPLPAASRPTCSSSWGWHCSCAGAAGSARRCWAPPFC
jgi:hypothetical protein